MSRRHPEAKAPFRQPPTIDGAKRCRWCWGPVGKGRRTFCGDACVEEYRILHDWNFVRELVLKRDHGVCAMCGVDTRKPRHAGSDRMYSTMFSFEVDHILPRHDGGTNELTNLRLLCRPCHRGVTTAFARERARRRREAKAALFVEGPSA